MIQSDANVSEDQAIPADTVCSSVAHVLIAHQHSERNDELVVWAGIPPCGYLQKSFKVRVNPAHCKADVGRL